MVDRITSMVKGSASVGAQRRASLALGTCIGLFALIGCGQKGRLVLPQSPVPVAPSTTASAAAATAPASAAR